MKKSNYVKGEIIVDCLVDSIQDDPKIHIAFRTQGCGEDSDRMLIFHINTEGLDRRKEIVTNTAKVLDTAEFKKFIKLYKEFTEPDSDNPNGLVSVYVDFEDPIGVYKVLLYQAPVLTKTKKRRDDRDYYDFYI